MPAVLVVLFSAVIAVVLCLLHLSNLQARQHCRELYDTIQVKCTVTNLSGDRTDGLNIGNDELALFAPELQFTREEWVLRPETNMALAELIEDVQIKASISVTIAGESYSLRRLFFCPEKLQMIRLRSTWTWMSWTLPPLSQRLPIRKSKIMC